MLLFSAFIRESSDTEIPFDRETNHGFWNNKDSDHVVVLDDSMQELAKELVRSNVLDKTCIGLDFFDASINRVGALALGARTVRKALLIAFLEPLKKLQKSDQKMNGFTKLALLEESKSLPWNLVWDEYCHRSGVPDDSTFIYSVMEYEKNIMKKR